MVNFQGKCRKCGKFGHKAQDCTNLNGSNSNSNGNASNLKGNSTGGNGNSRPTNNRKFQGKCNHCGAKGHKEADCWQKEENAHKHPKNWKQRDARTEVNASNVEQLLAYIKIEENFVFKLCGGLINDWKEEVEKSAASGLSDTHTGDQCKT